ncbi:TetR/AcrR family transcriptional regulator [Halobacillus litoralis]|uniref:TetR/AcrR family transcriptional regulator n=1 Tax=Halobacillus litoralis TaxID=45668 RepID=UPI001CFE69AA|nr:TetR/AcrR family transcriptional regulator [Halobacillus litoralis]
MTKEIILTESLKLFASHGYENTSLANIAEAVGIKKPSLYNHFKNKESIFLHVLSLVTDREKEYWHSYPQQLEEKTIQEQLHHIYRSYLDRMAHTTEGMFFKRVTFFPPEEFISEVKKAFLFMEDQMTEVIRPVLEQGKKHEVIRPFSTDTLTSAFYTLMDGLFLEENFYDYDVFEQRQKASWEIFWLGIQASEKEE